MNGNSKQGESKLKQKKKNNVHIEMEIAVPIIYHWTCSQCFYVTQKEKWIFFFMKLNGMALNQQ